nr:hypothetical protein [Ktedonobacterales bacterium]
AISWSPEGTLVVLPAIATAATSASSSPIAEPAAILLAVNGGRSSVLRATASLASPSAFLWDVRSGTLVSQLSYPLPLALRYRCTADGGITPEQSLSVTPNASLTTGSPVSDPGSGAFSIWQQRTIRTIYADTTGQPRDPVDIYAAPVSAWSPDGRYVAPTLVLGSAPLVGSSPVALAKLTPGSCTVKGLPPCRVGSVLSYPDRAFAQVAARFASATPSGDGVVPVAWTPDGKRLATMLPGDNFSSAGTPVSVTLLDATTGNGFRRFQVLTRSETGVFPTYTDLFWSPTGRQLAFMDTYTSTITMWGGSSLLP